MLTWATRDPDEERQKDGESHIDKGKDEGLGVWLV